MENVFAHDSFLGKLHAVAVAAVEVDDFGSAAGEGRNVAAVAVALGNMARRMAQRTPPHEDEQEIAIAIGVWKDIVFQIPSRAQTQEQLDVCLDYTKLRHVFQEIASPSHRRPNTAVATCQ